MPLGLNRSDPNNGGTSYRNGTPITEPHDFGNDVTWPTPDPTHFGNPITEPHNFGNPVTWQPSPAHFGNTIAPPYPAPTFTSVSPNNGPTSGGTSIAIVGSGFSAPGLEVLIGGNPCTGVSASDDMHLSATTPAGIAGATDIEIITDGGSVDTPNAWTYNVPAIALIDHSVGTGNQFGVGQGGVTTPAINSTGASMLIVAVNGYQAVGNQNSGEITINDSNGNTYLPVPFGYSAPNPGLAIFYCVNPITGSGHTVNVEMSDSGAGGYVAFSAWSNTHSLVPRYQYSNSGNTNIAAPFQGGSVSPVSAAGDLILSFIGGYNGFSGTSGIPATVDSGFTIIDSEFSATPAEGGGVGGFSYAYLIPSSTASVNPTWTMQPVVTGAMVVNVAFTKVSTAEVQLVAFVKGASGSSLTTSPINTTGADFLIAQVQQYSTSGAPANFSDNKGNTWTLIPWNNSAFNGKGALYYAFNATVGSGHTFSTTAGDVAISVMAFSGVQSSSDPFTAAADANSTTGVTTFQPGSVTPNAAGDLIVTSLSNVFIQNPIQAFVEVNDGFLNIGWTPANINDPAGSMAYASAAGATGVNPTWTLSSGGNAPTGATGANIATFKHA